MTRLLTAAGLMVALAGLAHTPAAPAPQGDNWTTIKGRITWEGKLPAEARKKIDPKVDEAIETLNMKDGPSRRKLLAGTGLVSATAAASALLTACGSASSSSGTVKITESGAAAVAGSGCGTSARKGFSCVQWRASYHVSVCRPYAAE